jgi:hypothetical protein
MEKYDTAGEVINDNIIWNMRFACWITKAADTHSRHNIALNGHCQLSPNGGTNQIFIYRHNVG